ncbi:MAG: threonylcarbamoyl-AMP synthase [Ignavibacteriales bacterium]|nr:MAG: threonylcarbamoyl-AMP synthase [Ignavibacteriales bacterium]
MLQTKIIKLINTDTRIDEAVQKARTLYFEGQVFIYPTDTIYGLGGNPFNDEVVGRINEIKGRSNDKKYILLIGSIEQLQKYIELNSENHLDFLISIWPNPVSVVLKLNSKTRELLQSDTAAFRVPNSRFCLKLLNEIQMPLISTSVNRANRESLLQPSVIEEEFGHEVEYMFFTKRKSYYVASTLIDLTGSEPVLLREGKIQFDDIIKKFR